MSQHGNLAIALRRKPIELDDAPFANEGFMAVPRIVTPLERQQRSRNRRYFNDNVIEIAGRSQQSQSAPRLVPTLVHVDENGDDFGD
jgi:hypothetical protein